MAIGTREEELVSLKPARQAPSRVGLRRLLGRDWATAWLFLAPCLLVLVARPGRGQASPRRHGRGIQSPRRDNV